MCGADLIWLRNSNETAPSTHMRRESDVRSLQYIFIPAELGLARLHPSHGQDAPGFEFGAATLDAISRVRNDAPSVAASIHRAQVYAS